MNCYQPRELAITGATGALGFAFLQRLFQDRPHLRARLLVRRASAAFQHPAFQSWLQAHADRLTLLEGDMKHLQIDQVQALLETDGGLWHFAAVTSLTAVAEGVARDIHAVNALGTERLVEGFLQAADPSPFYHISTAYVVGLREGLIREEESQMGQTFRNPYEASKLAAELHVQRASALGQTGAIFRPSVVVDNIGGTSGFKMVDACAYSVALSIKRGEPFVFRLPETASLNLVHSDWVIAAMIDLARLPSGSGLTYHLSAPVATRFRDIATLLQGFAPGLKISFEPQLTRQELPTASRIFDKAVTEIRQYLVTDVQFDRTQVERDLSPDLKETPLHLSGFVQARLEAELGDLMEIQRRTDFKRCPEEPLLSAGFPAPVLG